MHIIVGIVLAVAKYHQHIFWAITLEECNSTLEDSSIDSGSTTGKDCTSNDTCCSTNGTSKQPVKCFVLHCVRGTVDD